MKVFVRDLPLEGKVTFDDPRVHLLQDKFRSDKAVFFSVEFIHDQPGKAECFLIPAAAKLEYVVEDMDKIERNLYAAPDKKELFQKALGHLEQEQMLNGFQCTDEERTTLKNLNLFTIKPGLAVPDGAVSGREPQVQQILKELIDCSGRIFFFTAGKKDSHAWDVYRGTPIVEAAGKIHTDLQRGFIRAEVYNVKDAGLFGTVQEAKAKGLLKTVERTYVVEDGDVVDIKFSV